MENFKYLGKYIQVSELQIGEHTREKAYLPNGVIIFPFNDKGQLMIIREYRPHENIPNRLKFISGHLEKNENVLETANRELQEEVGFKAKKLEIFHEHHSSGTINNSLYFVIASDLTPSKLPNPDGEETIMETLYYDLDVVKEMILTDKIPFTFTALGVFKLEQKLKNNDLDIST